METEELIRRCRAIKLSGVEEGKATFKSKMKSKGEHIVAGCLVGKVLTNKSVNKEGLKIALQQAWQNKREVKVESLGDNVFLFKFGTEIDKKKALTGGPWHFAGALIVFTEPKGIGDLAKQSFTHVSFWVQLQNVPIMCMDRETISELGEAIGKVEEVETDANGDCMGEVIRIRISIDITNPLMKILEIRQEDMTEEEDISVLIRYERLPDFCYCCGCLGHQYRECSRYEKQLKEELAYGPWIKAPTMAEKLNQIRRRNKENVAVNQSPEPQTQTENQNSTNTGRQVTGAQTGQENGSKLARLPGSTEKQLMTDGDGPKYGESSCKQQKETTKEVQTSREQDLEAGKQNDEENWRESQKTNAKLGVENGKNQVGEKEREFGVGQNNPQDIIPQLGQTNNTAQTALEEVGRKNRLVANNLKPKKKWKIQARGREQGLELKKVPTSMKRLASEVNWASPEKKKKKVDSLTFVLPIISPKAKQMLRWEGEEEQNAGSDDMAVENTEEISAEADYQPRRQS